MQTRQLARILRKEHRETKSWPAVGRMHGISSGLAWKIANENYDPADPGIRAKLDLGPRPCPTCHRRVTVPHSAPRRLSLFDYPNDELLQMLEQRQVMR